MEYPMNCPHCNHPNLDDAHYCARCGQELKPQFASPTPEPVRDFTAPPQETIQRVEYAGFWLRFVAAIIDGLIVFAVNWLFTLLMKDNKAGSFVVSVIIGWLYYALQESSSRQATFGKLALGICVTDISHKRISFARATGRHFAKWISAIILFIGFIMVAFTEKKQGLHDMLADTLVVKR
jgi:uncharacterized RDD family membrane protein YckC